MVCLRHGNDEEIEYGNFFHLGYVLTDFFQSYEFLSIERFVH